MRGKETRVKTEDIDNKAMVEQIMEHHSLEF